MCFDVKRRQRKERVEWMKDRDIYQHPWLLTACFTKPEIIAIHGKWCMVREGNKLKIQGYNTAIGKSISSEFNPKSDSDWMRQFTKRRKFKVSDIKVLNCVSYQPSEKQLWVTIEFIPINEDILENLKKYRARKNDDNRVRCSRTVFISSIECEKGNIEDFLTPNVDKNIQNIEETKKYNDPIALSDWVSESSSDNQECLIETKEHSKNEQTTILGSHDLKVKKSRAKPCPQGIPVYDCEKFINPEQYPPKHIESVCKQLIKAQNKLKPYYDKDLEKRIEELGDKWEKVTYLIEQDIKWEIDKINNQEWWDENLSLYKYQLCDKVYQWWEDLKLEWPYIS